MANFGGAAAGANVGMQQVDRYQAQQFALQQARQQAAERQAAQNAQQAAMMAYRKTMADVYGPQPPMPGQPSVPMQQPPQAIANMPTGGFGPAGAGRGVGQAAGSPTPALPPYRALQRGGQTPVGPGAGVAPMQQFELPPKPPRPQLDLQAVMKNAPQDPEAFDMYMGKMAPYLSAQQKGELEQAKLELQYERVRNQLYESEQRIALATTPAERKAALEANLAIKKQLADIAQENADTRKKTAETKVDKGSEKKQQLEADKTQEIQLITELRTLVRQHPEVVGLRGGVTRLGEAIGGATGATQSTVANDFQRKVRMLQNIVKKIDAYGPEGRVLKGELADRDVLVKGLGSFTSAPSVLSGLDDLERYAKMRGGSSGTGGSPKEPKAAILASGPTVGSVETDDQGRRYKFKGGNPNDAKNWERL